MIEAVIIAAAGAILGWLVLIIRNKGLSQARQRDASHKAATDYGHYRMSLVQFALTVLLAGGIAAALGLLFYRSGIIAALFFPLGFLYPRIRAKQIAERKRQQLNGQFKQVLYSLSSLLSAGRSVESAFRDVANDLSMIYPDPNTAILRELERINNKLAHGGTIEQSLTELSSRSGLEDIRNFADVFNTCKRTGGNLVEVVRRTAGIIAEKIEVKQEIAVMMAQKRFESRVLSIAPLVVVGFLSFTSPDYMAPLYSTLQGRFIMSIALVALIICTLISEKIMRIHI